MDSTRIWLNAQRLRVSRLEETLSSAPRSRPETDRGARRKSNRPTPARSGEISALSSVAERSGRRTDGSRGAANAGDRPPRPVPLTGSAVRTAPAPTPIAEFERYAVRLRPLHLGRPAVAGL